MLRFGLLLAVFLSVVFSICCGYGWLFPFFLHAFSACCSFGCPFLFLSLFSVCCDSSCSIWSSSRFFRILGLWLLFAFGTPPVVFRAVGSPLAVPQWTGCCFPCVSASFLSYGFHRLFRFSSMSLGLRFLPWCLFLLVLVGVFFAPVLVLSLPVLPCSVAVAFWLSCFLTLSNLRFPSRRGLPLGRVSLASASVYLGFELPAYAGILSVLSLLRSSALFTSGILLVSCSPGGLRLVSLVHGLVRCWFLSEPFLVPTRSCSFRPSSSACPSLDLRFPSRRGLPFGRVHGSSRYFSCFLFRGFRALPSFSVGLVPLFLLQAVVFLLSAFFFCLVYLFPSSRASFRFFLLLSSGSSLGRVCLALGVLAGVSFGFSSFVSQCYGPPGYFFRGFPPLLLSPFSPVAWSQSVVRYGFLPRSLSKLSRRSLLLASLPGCFSSCITFWHVLSSGARPPPSLLCPFLWEVCCFPPVALLPCTVRALPLFWLVLLFFPLVLVVFSFLLVLLLVLFLLPSFIRSAFFADSSSCSSGSSLSPVSSSSSSSLAFSFRPRSSVRVSGV